MRSPITLEPVGVVVEGYDRDRRGTPRYLFQGTLLVYPEYEAALDGVENYSHLLILSYLDRAVPGATMASLERHGSPDRIGVFATRSPHRPNPLGLSLVRLVSREGPLLRVQGLDLWTGTPVLDIKPYDLFDIVCRPRVPDWSRRQWEAQKSLLARLGWPGPFCENPPITREEGEDDGVDN